MDFLNAVYKELDFESGALYDAAVSPSAVGYESDWLDKGEWLTAAKRAGAEKLFFVENNPVVVFASCNGNILDKIRTFNRIWCLARPRLLFLASPGEITVYDLAGEPVDENAKHNWNKLRYLDIIKSLHNVSKGLERFHRDHIESGRIFADSRFRDLSDRADKALIRDLKTVRRALVDAGLSGDKTRFAHTLIGRSIFIRYLEDRKVLTKEYFLQVAEHRLQWSNLLNSWDTCVGIDISGHTSLYSRVLQDKGFTFALYRKLAQDFNGDLFPDIQEEEAIVGQRHLKLVQDLLYGNAGAQAKLFFHSYRFDIIPLDLISSIYEEFYNSPVSDGKRPNARQDGAYYTPPVLAEFILARLLTPDILRRQPRVLDPACGSGIFLVEAFRRIVRYEWRKKGSPLSFDELKVILKNQISGIEVNPEAAGVAAFSLYLSVLNYLEPPAIDQQIKMGNKLPGLVASRSTADNDFHCILPANAFDVKVISSNPAWQHRFAAGCADIVVGNPPWGAPGNVADDRAKERHKVMLRWCKDNRKPIGDRETSQAFLWRALDFLKSNGKAGMLVSAGVLFKHNKTSQRFKERWFDKVRLEEVFNFAHVRRFFFKEAASPFLSIFFTNSRQEGKPIEYWSAREITSVQKLQAVIFSLNDRRTIFRKDLSRHDLWKCLWWGNDYDLMFINYLRSVNRPLSSVVRTKGQGFKVASKTKDASVLQNFDRVNIATFSRYDPLQFEKPPVKVERLGVIAVYSGSRLLVQRGISEKLEDKGQIIARYETQDFCFTNAVNGIKLKSIEDREYKLILGILWSSLARYFFFMTSANWGLWHHEIHLEDELLQLPFLPDTLKSTAETIIAIVDKLRNYCPPQQGGFYPEASPMEVIREQRHQWEGELDEAVFKLYGLNEEQKDLILDCCQITLPEFYRGPNSIGSEASIQGDDSSWVRKYIQVFCERWNAYLADNEEMRVEIHLGAHGDMLALEFFPADKEDRWDFQVKDDWSSVLGEIASALIHPMGASRIVLDSLVYVVSDDGIVIIKRNQKRLWTRSQARQDADATISKRMINTMPGGEIKN